MATKKLKKNNSPNYVTTLRSETCPAIAANIFRRTTPDGHAYLDFEISRAWKTENRQGYSSRFYSRNREGLKEVADRAADWIEQYPEAADGTFNHANNSQAQESASTSP